MERPPDHLGGLDRAINDLSNHIGEASGDRFPVLRISVVARALDDRPAPDAWTAGLGLGGQRLFIVPTLDLVVVTTAGRYGQPDAGRVPWEIFRHYVMDAVAP